MPVPLVKDRDAKAERRANAQLQPSGRTVSIREQKPLLPRPRLVFPPLHQLQRERKKNPKNKPHMNSAGFEAYWVKCIILPLYGSKMPFTLCQAVAPLLVAGRPPTWESHEGWRRRLALTSPAAGGAGMGPSPATAPTAVSAGGQRQSAAPALVQPDGWVMLELSWVLDCELEQLGWRHMWFWLCKRNSN